MQVDWMEMPSTVLHRYGSNEPSILSTLLHFHNPAENRRVKELKRIYCCVYWHFKHKRYKVREQNSGEYCT